MDRDGRARVGLSDVFRLASRLGAERLNAQRDPGQVVCRWAGELMQRDRATAVEIGVLGREFLLVGDRARSDHVLASSPAAGSHPAGRLKTEAMRFLAPGALTIAEGDAWTQLRAFNERVLGTGGRHPFAQTLLSHLRAAFAQPVSSRAEIQAAMGRAMVKFVLGRDALNGPDPAREIAALLAVVGSPVRRKLLGFWYARRRDRLYQLLDRAWDATDDHEPILLALARRVAPALGRRELLEQVPHWMFTFTGSGTDLLTRSLCMVTARPSVRRRVADELAAAGPPDRAETIDALHYLNACILEAGRLFPPVTRTFHRHATRGGASVELVHWFPLLQRAESLGPSVHAFQPERWLRDELDVAAATSNLFLRGPRACPGKDLILFVCRAAIAQQVAECGLELNGHTARSSRLANDPLPVSFPEREAHFIASEAHR